MTWCAWLACTVCDSPGGAAVRAAIVGDGGLGRNVLAVVLPVAVCAAVVAVVYSGIPCRRSTRDGDRSGPAGVGVGSDGSSNG